MVPQQGKRLIQTDIGIGIGIGIGIQDSAN
jgi:hypothetical protein